MRTVVVAAIVLCSCSDSEGDRPGDVAVTDVSAEVQGEVTAEVASDSSVEEAETTTPVVYPTLTIEWTPCNELYGEETERVDCAKVEVPLDWDHPDDGTITVAVKRVRSAVWDTDPDGPHRALWIFLGGPGQGGAGGESTAQLLTEEDPELDVYIIHHRGTGESTRMSCQGEAFFSQAGAYVNKQEWPGCRDEITAEWGDSMRFFSTTMAAHDAAGLIAATHPRADLVTVIGISYGTYLANRYMQIADQHVGGLADGVVLDSICPGAGCYLSAEDLYEDDVAKQIVSHCQDDEACSQRFSGPTGVWDAIGELYTDILAGHCPITDFPESDVENLRTALGNLAFGFAGRRAMPALVHRYQRCNADDVAVIRHVYERTLGFDPGAAPPGPYTGYSWTLSTNIVLSELWEPSDPDAEELLERWRSTRSCRGVGEQKSWQLDGWPRYQDPLAGKFAEVDIPILAMNGDLDPATPAQFARTIESHLMPPYQRYIEIPGSAHGVIAQGQLLSEPQMTCGSKLLLQFVKDPKAELDTSCLADVMPLGFFMRDQAVELFFGTPDMWGDGEPE